MGEYTLLYLTMRSHTLVILLIMLSGSSPVVGQDEESSGEDEDASGEGGEDKDASGEDKEGEEASGEGEEGETTSGEDAEDEESSDKVEKVEDTSEKGKDDVEDGAQSESDIISSLKYSWPFTEKSEQTKKKHLKKMEKLNDKLGETEEGSPTPTAAGAPSNPVSVKQFVEAGDTDTLAVTGPVTGKRNKVGNNIIRNNTNDTMARAMPN